MRGKILILCMLFALASVASAQDIERYREVVPYPYHAAPYFSYPVTTEKGYVYPTPVINNGYQQYHNNQEIIEYPDGTHHYRNYYSDGISYCHVKAHKLMCDTNTPQPESYY